MTKETCVNIVIPMAGRGSRFASAGYSDPKPLIPIGSAPMIKVVIDNIRPSRPHRFIFICQKEHLEKYGLREKLSAWAPGCVAIAIEEVTEGAACTVLLAEEHIDDNPLMIANSDQYVDYPIDDYLSVLDRGFDGLIMTMAASDPKWSFVGLNKEGLVTQVVEKEVISNEATVGIYNFARGTDFIQGAQAMIARNKRVNGEFYVAPVYNELIAKGARVAIANVGTEGDGMYGLGIPADLDFFLAHPIFRKANGS